ncbi:hypothetical protein NP493_1562g00019, partial [Ridgeia piscesae]
QSQSSEWRHVVVTAHVNKVSGWGWAKVYVDGKKAGVGPINGHPAQNVPIKLFRQTAVAQWQQLSSGNTNADGRFSDIISRSEFVSGRYKLTFYTDAYFRQINVTGFSPNVDVVFEISDPGVHYHVPLLLNPFGYSTYIGS